MIALAEMSLPIPQEYILQLRSTPQNPRFHAEGNVYNHTLMVLDMFRKYRHSFQLSMQEEEVMFWAAILHDIGKPATTEWKVGRWTSHGHEAAGVPIAKSILQMHPELSKWQKQQILDLVEWHHVPLRWGLRKEHISRYHELAEVVNLRLLGIFAYFDVQGRLCVRKPEAIAQVEHFQKQIAPNFGLS